MKNASAASKPFYLHLWWHMSHDTIDPRPEQTADFPVSTNCFARSTAANQTICPSQIYWGAQQWSDRHRFGPVIAAVDEMGLRNNTYIIFSTDNGMLPKAYDCTLLRTENKRTLLFILYVLIPVFCCVPLWSNNNWLRNYLIYIPSTSNFTLPCILFQEPKVQNFKAHWQQCLTMQREWMDHSVHTKPAYVS